MGDCRLMSQGVPYTQEITGTFRKYVEGGFEEMKRNQNACPNSWRRIICKGNYAGQNYRSLVHAGQNVDKGKPLPLIYLTSILLTG